jgi:hypothetical protein
MHPFRMLSLILGLFLLSGAVAAQDASPQIAPPAGEGASVVIRSLAAQGGSSPITDVTLTGTARRIIGSDDETGTVVLKALATGETRVDLSFPSGDRSEVRTNSEKGPVGQWRGPDGALHPIPLHNLMADDSWFFPAFVLRRLSSSQGFVARLAGNETRNGIAVQHISSFQQTPIWVGQAANVPPHMAALFQHTSQVDLYLDSSSLLPVAMTFNAHPDNNAGRDFPIEIRFSDYHAVDGVQVPFHVEQYLNNGLILELQFDSAVLNSGLSASSFTIH